MSRELLLSVFIVLCFGVSLCRPALAQAPSPAAPVERMDAQSGYTKYGYDYPRPSGDDSYHPVQALHGFGAIFVALGEPLFFRPAVWIKEGLNETHGRVAVAAVPACAVAGMLEGIFYSAFDLVVGTTDVLSFGYFRLSERAGIFDYFSDERPLVSQPPPAPPGTP